MTHVRFVPLFAAITIAASLAACSTSPAMPMMGSASATGAAASRPMAMMDEQMKTMRAAHEKMMNAKTPEERSKLMAEHMKAMQGGMDMMKGMGGGGMGGMKGMGAAGDMGTQQTLMAKQMEMMQTMMEMMEQHMKAATPSQ
ncbi:MAG TPA: hypothetical protein VLI46_06195 [Ramlibacter sp.]|nr:hypothetical protein [Ramlibacter sp.]